MVEDPVRRKVKPKRRQRLTKKRRPRRAMGSLVLSMELYLRVKRLAETWRRRARIRRQVRERRQARMALRAKLRQRQRTSAAHLGDQMDLDAPRKIRNKANDEPKADADVDDVDAPKDPDGTQGQGDGSGRLDKGDDDYGMMSDSSDDGDGQGEKGEKGKKIKKQQARAKPKRQKQNIRVQVGALGFTA
eukprot:gb/GFBE01020080.1/.p1 GENE.gb/GFBE01020080.1/~~gb/GFBE01020080.1/.p1  ORF type:complete len:189 (+),score=37.31 gb/GFBE01020080.1/:1-567(+)